VPAAVLEAMSEHRARLERLAERRTLIPLKRLYDEAGAELERKLAAAARGRAGDTMTAYQQRMLLAQVKEGKVRLARSMAGTLGDASQDAQVDALRGLTRDVARLERQFRGATVTLPIEQAARFRGVVDRRRTSLLRMHATSMARYGAQTIGRMERELSLSLATGETTGSAIDRVMRVDDMEWYRAERIGRTETAWAFGATTADGIAESAEALPGLMMRWSEYVDDATGRPLDDRVAVDSLAMHGQVTAAGDVFTMPSSSPVADAKGRTQVPPALVGLTWSHPPNRPNDRAVLQPFRKEWGIPGWVWRGGRRVSV